MIDGFRIYGKWMDKVDKTLKTLIFKELTKNRRG